MIRDEDIIGDISGIPIGVVNLMLLEQVVQGNKKSIEVFQKSKDANKINGGFSWDKSVDGCKFWSRILNYKKYDEFYEKYANTKELNVSETLEAARNFFDTKKEDDKINELKTKENKIMQDKEYQEKVDYIKSLNAGNTITVMDVGVKKLFILLSFIEDKGIIVTCTKKTYDNITSSDRPACYTFTTRDVIIEREVQLTLEDISAGKGVGVPVHLIKIIQS